MRKSQPVLIGIMVIILLTLAFEGRSASGIDYGEIPFSEQTPFFQVQPGTFNVQIQALEITQGVRGEIPTRIPPGESLVLPTDGAVQIANRRTIVRVYPWIETGLGSNLPTSTARLWAFKDGVLLSGSPISPVNHTLENIEPGVSLEYLRRDPTLSWNFLLPVGWTAGSPERKSFALRFVVEANPPGQGHIPECQGCSGDNLVSLGGQEFVTVPTLVIKPYFIQHTLMDRDGTQVTFPGPTAEEFDAAIQTLHKLLPIGDRDQGLEVLPPTYVDWQGPLFADGNYLFAEEMIQKYLPGGSLKKNQDGIYHIFLFSSDTKHNFLVNYNSNGVRLGLAWKGKPYVQSSANGLELVHELTHALGLSHAGNQYGEAAFNPDYPDESGRVEPDAYGFDIWEMRTIPPISEQGETHDFMSYNSTDPAWVSIYTWETISSLLGQPELDV